MSTPLIRAWYALAVSFVAVIVVGLVCIWYTNWQQERNDRRWCSLFAALNPEGTPPTNERGRVIAEQIEIKRREFHCPKR